MELIKNSYPYSDFEKLHAIRKKLLQNAESIYITDFGAGSKKLHSNNRKIKDIVRHGIAPKKQAEFLYRLINYFNSQTIIELGTSIGLSTLYMAKAKPSAKVYTLEGSEELVNFSKKLFKQEVCKNIELLTGNFNDTFPQLLNKITTVDFLYIDGNHAYEPTMRYFNLALEKINPQSIILIDDINWSDDMQMAWIDIKENEKVTLSLDFFHFGIVFFRPENKQKEHFMLRF